MTALAWLIPVALFLGLLGLAAFLWSLRSGQFEDLEGAAYRILEDDPSDDIPPAEKQNCRAEADVQRSRPTTSR
jgi:cbb3-type cytochrome oxidase maturation protein